MIMEFTIRATDLARNLGDVLSKVRYRRDSFVIERNGTRVARVVPIAQSASEATVGEALTAWLACASDDPTFADDLALISAADRPPVNPWES